MTPEYRRTAGSPSTPMVYVVDPDEAVRESLCVLLATFGVAAEGFSDAEEFLAAFEGGGPACLVTEVDLPGRDGVALLEHLNARDPSLPAIVVARNGNVESAVRAMRAGAVDYMEKPFVDRVLVERLLQVLAHQTAAASRAAGANLGGSRSPRKADVRIRIERILMPTDFSDCAAAALGHAVALAQQFDAKLHFLHVVVLYGEDPHRPGHDFSGLDEIRGRLEERASGEMKRLVDERPTGKARIHKAQRRAVSPAPAILDYAAEEAIDLIVLGTHGRRGLRRFLLGSVAEEVVRSAACPVLTVRDERETCFLRFDRIVVPSDFSADSRRALEVAAELAAIYGSRIDLVHVVAPPIDPRLGVPRSDSVSFDSSHLDEARSALAGLVDQLGQVGVPIEVHVLDGYPASSIARHAETTGTDLIVLASHGLSGFYRFLLGSVAERVIRAATCPVLTLRPPAGEAAGGKRPDSPGRSNAA